MEKKVPKSKKIMKMVELVRMFRESLLLVCVIDMTWKIPLMASVDEAIKFTDTHVTVLLKSTEHH